MKTDKSHIDILNFKHVPFMVPEGYFEQLEKDIVAQTSSDTIIPSHFSTAVPFKVSDVYFEELTNGIQNSINKRSGTVPFNIRPVYWSAVAAMLVGAIFWFQYPMEKKTSVNNNDIAEYLVDEEDLYPFADDQLILGTPNLALISSSDFQENIALEMNVSDITAMEELNEIAE